MSSTPSQPTSPTIYTPAGETFIEKAKRKTVEEPLVPIGVLGTVVAITMATRQFRRGDRASMNRWLRFRVAAQGFTILAICTYGFAVRWRKQESQNSSIEGSIIPDTPATLHAQAAKDKEKEEFERRMDEAVAKDKIEQQQRLLHEQDGKEKVDWKAAWKEGILKKNRENDERRVRAAERKE